MSAAPRPTERSVRLAYSPALDGLRAICLLGVLFFHSPFTWMSGGFLGVSTFFTLSGYLIATLLLRERRASQRIDLAAFWDRRLRRLGPALWLGVLAVVTTAPWWLDADSRERLLADATATLAYVSNWRFMSPEYAYAQLFSHPSPLQHSWSLSIEAQYYLVFPLLVIVALRRRQTVAPLAALLVGCIGVSIAMALADAADSDAINRVYYGTLSRAAEPLAGALLAVWLDRRQSNAASRRAELGSALAGGLAGVLMLAAWSLSEVASAWLYHGGFALHGLLSAVLIGALTKPGTPLTRAFSLAPLPWIGRLSYGAYIYHWPIFLVLSPARTGLGPLALLALRLVLTLGCAWVSLELLEQPVRTRRLLATKGKIFAASLLAPAVAAAFAIGALPGPTAAPTPTFEPGEATRLLGRPPRISAFGDSTALKLSMALHPWLKRAGLETRRGDTQRGCGLLDRGTWFFRDHWAPTFDKCKDTSGRWQRQVEAVPVDAAWVLVGPWDVLSRRFAPDEPSRAFGDPEFDRAYTDAIDQAVEAFRSHGVGTIWLTAPPVALRPDHWKDLAMLRESTDPKRMLRLNQLLEEAAQRWPNDLEVVDFAGYLRRQGVDLQAADIRPDGVHFTQPAMGRFVDDWLGPQMLRAVDELVARANPRAGAALPAGRAEPPQ